MAIVARIARSSMLDVLGSEYVRTARAKGAAPWRVVLRHALPNAAPPIVNIAGFQIGLLLSGAVLTETVFDWPGIGLYAVQAAISSDFEPIMGATIVLGFFFMLTNFVIDILYGVLDPRVRQQV